MRGLFITEYIPLVVFYPGFSQIGPRFLFERYAGVVLFLISDIFYNVIIIACIGGKTRVARLPFKFEWRKVVRIYILICRNLYFLDNLCQWLLWAQIHKYMYMVGWSIDYNRMASHIAYNPGHIGVYGRQILFWDV